MKKIFMICMILSLVSCKTVWVVDKEIQMGGDVKDASYDSKTETVKNIKEGDVVVFYNPEAGDEYESTDIISFELGHYEEETEKNKTITKPSEYYGLKVTHEISGWDLLTKVKREENQNTETTYLGLENTGTKTIKGFAVAVKPPKGAKFKKVYPEDYSVIEKKDYILIKSNFEIKPAGHAGVWIYWEIDFSKVEKKADK